MAVIELPDVAGIACNYINNAVFLSGPYMGYGLPNYSKYVYPNQIQAAIAASDTDLCEKYCIDFFDLSTNTPTTWQWFFEGGSPDTSTLTNPLQICYSDSGLFDVTLIACNNAGCDTVVLADYITVYGTPPAPFITQSGNILMASAAVSYQWQFNAVNIPGATNQSYEITQSGTYTVVITDENGCTNYISIAAEYVGIDAADTENTSVLIYPNPFYEQLILESGNGFLLHTVQLHDAIGREIRNYSLEGETKFIMSTTELASGIYFIRINQETTSILIKP
jgi:hypothetical protein